MPRVVKPADVERLQRAGALQAAAKPEPPKPTIDPQVQVLSAQVADLSARLASLDKAQLAAVLGAAQQAQKNTSELAAALTVLLKSRPAQKKEKWRLTVTQHDPHTGRIVGAELEQVE